MHLIPYIQIPGGNYIVCYVFHCDFTLYIHVCIYVLIYESHSIHPGSRRKLHCVLCVSLRIYIICTCMYICIDICISFHTSRFQEEITLCAMCFIAILHYTYMYVYMY